MEWRKETPSPLLYLIASLVLSITTSTVAMRELLSPWQNRQWGPWTMNTPPAHVHTTYPPGLTRASSHSGVRTSHWTLAPAWWCQRAMLELWSRLGLPHRGIWLPPQLSSHQTLLQRMSVRLATSSQIVRRFQTTFRTTSWRTNGDHDIDDDGYDERRWWDLDSLLPHRSHLRGIDVYVCIFWFFSCLFFSSSLFCVFTIMRTG